MQDTELIDLSAIGSGDIDSDSLESVKKIILDHMARVASLEHFERALGSPFREHLALKAAIHVEESIRFEEVALAIHQHLPDRCSDAEKIIEHLRKIKVK